MLPAVLDHLGINISDYGRSRQFYERALAPLGFELLMEPIPGTGGFGREGKPWFWITDQRQPTTANVHVAFTAPDRATVDAFHAAALEAGGTDNGGPGIREIYHPDYYGAYVLDLDGNNVEAVCHQPE
jgi:catechol 2,3-dioxygenase-like lactoylglutathione lyase family enzyme